MEYGGVLCDPSYSEGIGNRIVKEDLKLAPDRNERLSEK
jgi:hypothetical protein